MHRVPQWRGTWLALAAAVLLSAAACSGSAATSSSSAPTAPASTAQPSASLVERLGAADAKLRASLGAWRASDPTLLQPPPQAALAAAAQEREIVHLLAQDRAVTKRTLAALPSQLAASVRADILAARGLRRLTGAPPKTPLRLVPPRPAGELLADYRLAEARFGVRWQLLAAVHLVESAFGRVVSHSSAGAQGPMQFLPSTWRAYGLGGDINSSHDAILGAANYLHQSGAPADERRALYAYNPSRVYVAAVLTYARAIVHDPLGFLTYYTWEASLPATLKP
jgi:hypothetical protein